MRGRRGRSDAAGGAGRGGAEEGKRRLIDQTRVGWHRLSHGGGGGVLTRVSEELRRWRRKKALFASGRRKGGRCLLDASIQ